MQWVAYYTDGTWLRQYDDDGTERKYADIQRERLASFALYDGGVESEGSPYRSASRKLLHVHFEPGQRLIYRRRVEKHVGRAEDVVCHMVGWQQTVGGENIQSICYCFEDGTVEMAGRSREDHPWFYSVQAVPCEEISECST